MDLSRRKHIRASLSGILVLILFGIAGVDALLCRGSDGHLGLETYCCQAANLPVGSNFAPDRECSDGCSGECGSCQDTSLLQWIASSHHHAGPAPAGAIPASIIPFDADGLCVSTAVPAIEPHPVPVHLRFTSLLI